MNDGAPCNVGVPIRIGANHAMKCRTDGVKGTRSIQETKMRCGEGEKDSDRRDDVIIERRANDANSARNTKEIGSWCAKYRW